MAETLNADTTKIVKKRELPGFEEMRAKLAEYFDGIATSEHDPILHNYDRAIDPNTPENVISSLYEKVFLDARNETTDTFFVVTAKSGQRGSSGFGLNGAK